MFFFNRIFNIKGTRYVVERFYKLNWQNSHELTVKNLALILIFKVKFTVAYLLLKNFQSHNYMYIGNIFHN